MKKIAVSPGESLREEFFDEVVPKEDDLMIVFARSTEKSHAEPAGELYKM